MGRAFAVFVLFIGSILITWEMSVRWMEHPQFIVPAPSRILHCLFQHADRFVFHAKITLIEMLAGFLLALCVAFPIGWAMTRHAFARNVLQPLFIAVQCIPMFTLAPIMVIWFGWSFTAIVVPTALMIFFPLTLSIYRGLHATPVEHLEFFRVNGASAWQTFLKLSLPCAVPQLFAGLRISASIAGVGAVAGEWAGAQQGLGILMLESRRALDLEMTFAALFCIAALSLALYLAVTLLERIALPPRPSLRKLATASLLVMVSSCQSSGDTRLVLDWLPNPNHVPIYAGVEKGFFRDEGIDLEVLKVHDPSDVLSYVTSGMADVGISYMHHTVQAYARGADIHVVGALFKQPLNGLMFRSDSGIESLQDLSGKVIARSVGGVDHLMLEGVLRDHAVEPALVRKVGFDLVTVLGERQADALYGAYWNIEGAQFESLGIATDFLSIQEYGAPHFYELLLVTRIHSETFRSGFRRALEKSIAWSKAHPDEAFSIYAKANPDKRTATLAWEQRAWERTHPLLARDQSLDPDVFLTFYEWLKSVGPAHGISVPDREIAGLINQSGA
jgi:NitT/TauT family transport system substrate-binding protein